MSFLIFICRVIWLRQWPGIKPGSMMLLLRQFWLELVKVRSLAYITSIISQPSTRIKISQAITGLLAQQPCNNTVNMIGKITVLFKTQLDTTTKFMVVVTLLFNLVISSFPDNMFYHVWTQLLIYISWWFEQRWSSVFVHQAMNSLFQYAWTLNKLVNNIVQAG